MLHISAGFPKISAFFWYSQFSCAPSQNIPFCERVGRPSEPPDLGRDLPLNWRDVSESFTCDITHTYTQRERETERERERPRKRTCIGRTGTTRTAGKVGAQRAAHSWRRWWLPFAVVGWRLCTHTRLAVKNVYKQIRNRRRWRNCLFIVCLMLFPNKRARFDVACCDGLSLCSQELLVGNISQE